MSAFFMAAPTSVLGTRQSGHYLPDRTGSSQDAAAKPDGDCADARAALADEPSTRKAGGHTLDHAHVLPRHRHYVLDCTAAPTPWPASKAIRGVASWLVIVNAT